MKTKILKVFFIVLAISLLSSVFIGCGLSDEEKKAVGKYELIEIYVDEHPDINTFSYVYYTMELKSNRDCVISYRFENNTYNTFATWKMDKQGNIEITIKIGRKIATEKYKYANDFIIGTNVKESTDGNITERVRFQKQIAE